MITFMTYDTADAELESLADLATIQHQMLEDRDRDARGSNDPPGCSACNAIRKPVVPLSGSMQSRNPHFQILKSENIPL